MEFSYNFVVNNISLYTEINVGDNFFKKKIACSCQNLSAVILIISMSIMPFKILMEEFLHNLY